MAGTPQHARDRRDAETQRRQSTPIGHVERTSGGQSVETPPSSTIKRLVDEHPGSTKAR
jgi:hypothetical protein